MLSVMQASMRSSMSLSASSILVCPDVGAKGYLTQIAAACMACEVFPANQRSQILAPVNAMAAPATFISWLHQQPQSQDVQKCTEVLQQGPIKLTQHLLSGYVLVKLSSAHNSGSKNSMHGLISCSNSAKLLLAMHSATSVSQDGDEPAFGPGAADDAPFYVDEAGESAFGR